MLSSTLGERASNAVNKVAMVKAKNKEWSVFVYACTQSNIGFQISLVFLFPLQKKIPMLEEYAHD